MTGLSMVRMISHGVVCLAGRTESGGDPILRSFDGPDIVRDRCIAADHEIERSIFALCPVAHIGDNNFIPLTSN